MLCVSGKDGGTGDGWACEVKTEVDSWSRNPYLDNSALWKAYRQTPNQAVSFYQLLGSQRQQLWQSPSYQRWVENIFAKPIDKHPET